MFAIMSILICHDKMQSFKITRHNSNQVQCYIDALERLQSRATKMIPELRDLSYEERRMWLSNSRDKEVKRRSN